MVLSQRERKCLIDSFAFLFEHEATEVDKEISSALSQHIADSSASSAEIWPKHHIYKRGRQQEGGRHNRNDCEIDVQVQFQVEHAVEGWFEALVRKVREVNFY